MATSSIARCWICCSPVEVSVALAHRVLPAQLLAATLVLQSGCTAVVNRFAFYPDRTFALTAAQLPANVRHEFIPAENGEKIELFIVRVGEPRAVLLYFHGNGGNIAQRVPELQKLSAVTGATVIGVGYRGYGASTGHSSESGIYQDGEAALRYAQATLGFPAEKILLLGRSLGSTVAVHLGTRHKVGGIILVTPLLTGPKLVKAHGLGALTFLVGDSFDNLSPAPALTAPVLVVHGTDDEVIPFAHGEALFAAIKAPKRFVTIVHGHHNDLEFVDAKTFWDSIADFLQAPPK